jgi:Protein of unknown function (DUF3500)
VKQDKALVERMAEAARSLLDSLSPEQRHRAHWEFPSDEERLRWFYTPTDHGGLTIGEMGPAQQQATMRLLASGLSRAGYVTVSTIMGLENVLDAIEGWRVSFGHERGRDPGRYYVRVFGEPGADRWSWRFGGHHVSIHHTVVGGELRAFTPCFMGADPGTSPLLGPHQLRPLAACADLAFELLRSLTDEQRRVAVLSPAPPIDLVGANRAVLREGDGPLRLAHVWRNEWSGELLHWLERFQDSEEAKAGLTAAHVEAVRFTTTPKGLVASAMTASQQEMLEALLDTYVGRLPDEVAERETAKVRGPSFSSLHLAWAGSLDPGRPHYYRIQGHRLLVEYDNTTRDANHVHSVWRDPVGDFGMDLLGTHRRHGH